MPLHPLLHAPISGSVTPIYIPNQREFELPVTYLPSSSNYSLILPVNQGLWKPWYRHYLTQIKRGSLKRQSNTFDGRLTQIKRQSQNLGGRFRILKTSTLYDKGKRALASGRIRLL